MGELDPVEGRGLKINLTEGVKNFCRKDLMGYLVWQICQLKSNIEKDWEQIGLNIANLCDKTLNVPEWNLNQEETTDVIAYLANDAEYYGDDWVEYALEYFIRQELNSKCQQESDTEIIDSFGVFEESQYQDDKWGTSLQGALEIISQAGSEYIRSILAICLRTTESTHVSGGRGLLSSDTICHLSLRRSHFFGSAQPVLGDVRLVNYRELDNVHAHQNWMGSLAIAAVNERLHGDENADCLDALNKLIQTDMPSLQRYRFCADIRQVSPLLGAQENNVMDVEPESSYIVSFYIRDQWFDGNRRKFDEVGSGLSFLLPILSAAAYGTQLLTIEQPELHLHPRAQEELLRMLVRTDKQVVLETHSDTMVLALSSILRDSNTQSGLGTEKVARIRASPTLIAADVRLLYLWPEKGILSKDRSVTKAQKIQMANDGTLIDIWPTDGGFQCAGISPAFSQLKVYGHEDALITKLMSERWIEDLVGSEDLLRCLGKSLVARASKDWEVWILFSAKVIEDVFLNYVTKPFLLTERSKLQSYMEITLISSRSPVDKFIEFADFMLKRPTQLGLGNWVTVLRALNNPTSSKVKTNEQTLFEDWISTQPWYESWSLNQKVLLTHLEKIRPLRNIAIHQTEMPKVSNVVAMSDFLLTDDNKPGIFFDTFGLGIPKKSDDMIGLSLVPRLL